MNEVDFYLEDLKSRFKGIDPEKYYLSYSGGKDSHFLYWFIKEVLHEARIEIVAINTRMEHPEIMRRMYKYADRVLIPEHTIQWVIDKYGAPCFSKQKDKYIERYQNGCRTDSLMSHIYGKNAKTGEKEKAFAIPQYALKPLLSGELHKVSAKCCDFTKKKTAHKYEKESGKKPILGVRGAEGMQRKVMYRSCFTKDGTFTPIHDLPDEYLEAYFEMYNIEVPAIYAGGVQRTGCMGCPYGHYKGNTVKELAMLTPAQRKYVISLFHNSYDVLGIDYEHEQMQLDLGE